MAIQKEGCIYQYTVKRKSDYCRTMFKVLEVDLLIEERFKL